jgi:hypothetical protein
MALTFAVASVGCGGTNGKGSSPTNSSGTCPVGRNSLNAEVSVTCVDAVPFVHAAWPYTDSNNFPGTPLTGLTTATITTPSPGKICMAGRMENGFATMTLSFVTAEDAVSLRFLEPSFAGGLDTTTRGITQIRFTIDSPPAGTQVQLRSVLTNCDSTNCIRGDFYLSQGDPPAPVIVAGAGVPNQVTTVVAPIADFKKGPGPNPDWQLEPRNLIWFHAGPGNLAPMTGDYAFCVHDFALLDANGVEVQP